MGRMLPVECEHGVTIDWGDFGPDDISGEHCADCAAEDIQHEKRQAALEDIVKKLAAGPFPHYRNDLRSGTYCALCRRERPYCGPYPGATAFQRMRVRDKDTTWHSKRCLWRRAVELAGGGQ